MTVLGRSDKTKKIIVQEHAGFTSELARLYMIADVEVRVQAVKVIANFGVDFKNFLTIPGLVDQLIADIRLPADTAHTASLKKCAAFALKNLSFGCGSKHQETFDSVFPLNASFMLLEACMQESGQLRGHLMEQILLILRQQLNPVTAPRINDEE